MLLNHFGIVLWSLAAPEKVCSLGCSRSLYLTSLFPQLDVICLNAGIPPAKVHAVCSDVGHILAEDGEALYSQQKQDQELTVVQIMNSLLPNSDIR